MKIEFDIPDGFNVEGIRTEMEKKFQGLLRKYRPRRPNPGRPKHTSEEKQIRARGRMMLKYFDRLKGQLPPQIYTEYFQSYEEQLLTAVKNADSATIFLFDKTQPWTQRG